MKESPTGSLRRPLALSHAHDSLLVPVRRRRRLHGRRPLRREPEGLAETVEGHTRPQIAEWPFVSLSTVDSHVRSVHARHHVHHGSAAVAKAVRERRVESTGV